MKNMMSMVGMGALMITSGYGIYSFMNNNGGKMMKKMKKASKVSSPYTTNIK